jgi:magnesium-transporting ATPase (P-type)
VLLSFTNIVYQTANSRNYPSNAIKTSKYSTLTFLPLNLYNQFKKMANMYFLIISVMQTFKSISISDGKAAMALPLMFVIIVSMLKDAFEDYKRH